MFKPGTQIVSMSKVYRTGQVATIVCSYRGPFGPSWLVRFEDGAEVAMAERDMAIA